MFEKISQWISDGIDGFFSNFYSSMGKAFANNALAAVQKTSDNILQNSVIDKAMTYIIIIAISLLALKIVYEALQVYILRQNGDPDGDPGQVLIRAVQAIAVILSMKWLVQQIYIFGTHLVTDVSNFGITLAPGSGWIQLKDNLLNLGLPILIMAVVAGILLFIITIQAAIRGAELVLATLIGPFLALNLTSYNRSLWGSWVKQVIIINVTQALQLLMLLIALNFYGNIQDTTGLTTLVGWLFVVVKTPKFLQQFMHSTGFSGTVGGVGKQAGSMYLMRRMMGGR